MIGSDLMWLAVIASLIAVGGSMAVFILRTVRGLVARKGNTDRAQRLLFWLLLAGDASYVLITVIFSWDAIWNILNPALSVVGRESQNNTALVFLLIDVFILLFLTAEVITWYILDEWLEQSRKSPPAPAPVLVPVSTEADHTVPIHTTGTLEGVSIDDAC